MDPQDNSSTIYFRASTVIETAGPVNNVILSVLVKIGRDIDHLSEVVTDLGQDVASLKALSDVVGTPFQRRKRRTHVGAKVRGKKQRSSTEFDEEFRCVTFVS